MEAMLSSFQSDLSSISCEIQTLQEQSVAMNVRLRNRQAVRGRLSQLVDELVVPNVMIRSGGAEGPSSWQRRESVGGVRVGGRGHLVDASPSPVPSTILETPVTDQAFLEQLHELNNKINAVKEQAFRETMACTDVADILDKLKAKVRSWAPSPPSLAGPPFLPAL